MQDYSSVLEAAIKQRILDEISKDRTAQIINNFQGAPLASQARKPESIQEAMFDPGAYDYLVDITKQDMIDPETGKSRGWRKKVRRYREPVE